MGGGAAVGNSGKLTSGAEGNGASGNGGVAMGNSGKLTSGAEGNGDSGNGGKTGGVIDTKSVGNIKGLGVPGGAGSVGVNVICCRAAVGTGVGVPVPVGSAVKVGEAVCVEVGKRLNNTAGSIGLTASGCKSRRAASMSDISIGAMGAENESTP